MIEYRIFRNTDPPGLAEVWNEALTGRGAARLRTSLPLERFAYSKLYFDPAGLVLALDAGLCVGFVHAGFGGNAEGTALNKQNGVTCMLAVRPSHQGRGIGTELLRRSEEYLRASGAQRLYAGQRAPFNPFYLGVYGGSELPGFLASDSAAEPYFTRRGYQVHTNVRVLQRRLKIPVKVFDARFMGYRNRFELCEDEASRLSSWWEYNIYNGAEPRVFALMDKSNNKYAARATFWDMEGFSLRWGTPAIGMVDWYVRPDLRQQGIGKYMFVQLLRRAQEEMVEVVEVQFPADNKAALKLCHALGFEHVDVGRTYEKRE